MGRAGSSSPPARFHLPWISAIICFEVILADWATAVAAIGGALIGAAAGLVAGYLTFKGALMGIRSQEREAWRSRQIEAAQTFLHEYATFLGKIAEGVGGGEDLGLPQHRAISAANVDAVRAGTLVTLLFGEDSKVNEAANTITNGTSAAVALVRALVDADAATREVLKNSLQETLRSGNEASASFLRLVHAAIRPEES
jgi:hypothetical protein